ncbi:MAG: type I DNA topoisomerase [Bdellovibrionaceae bacterium]|nr:type I DNA topoisomerase [Pseudobdellovibrionaceae bacterium]
MAGAKKLVIVESPTKAKTIRKFLGPDYIVESCMGHVRDLPQSAKDIPEKFKKEKWSHLGVNVDKDFEPIYCVPRDKTKIVKNLKDKMADVDEVLLATDEDREGESISWHLLELLKPKVPVKRMVFHEITKSAIQESLNNFRDIDDNLVRAQEARRILDRLVGYTISPLLWKKVAYGLSAGRVQSVAVRMVVERENERMQFVSADYYGVYAQNKKAGVTFESRLQSYKGQRIASGKDFDANTGKLLENKKTEAIQVDEKLAKHIAQTVREKAWQIHSVEEKPVSRKPAPPFITSTLQQEANRKLGLGAKEAMRVAQKLYEEGYITYMRTDSTYLSEQALNAARGKIKELYGDKFLPKEIRTYQAKKVKGAQEAHEAIRPAGTEMLSPDETKLRGVQRDLYELIWKRTIASQMKDASILQVSAKIHVDDCVFAASGQVIEFPGFLKVYAEGTDEEDTTQENTKLPPLKAGEKVDVLAVTPKQHETKPPARYTEASLVQAMEREGIGRPSTYAAVIGTIIDRGYVNKMGGALVPTFTAMIVSNLLRTYLPTYVDVGFTSEMEKSLDDISTGDLDWDKYLKTIYFGKTGLLNQVTTQEEKIDPEKSREIGFNKLKGLSFRVGRYGAYVCRKKDGEEQCASLQDSVAPADITVDEANKLIDQKISGADALGKDPETGLPIYVLTGRYGPYVQLGDEEPKRSSLPPGFAIEDIDMPKALFLLSLPKDLGEHDDIGKTIKLGIGRFGPYVVCDGDFRSVPKSISFFDMNHAKAMELLRQPKKGRASATVLKEVGEHPETGDKIQILDGKYGPYVKCGKVNASLPEDADPKAITLAAAVELLAPKMKKAKGGKKAKAAKSEDGEAKKTTKAKSTKSAKNTKAKAADDEPTKPVKKVIKRRAKDASATAD